MIEFVVFALIGVLAGTSAGLLGLGGGLVTVPALLFVFQYLEIPAEHSMHIAVGTSLMAIIVTSLSSMRAHHHVGNVDWLVLRKLVLGLLLGGFLGAYLATLVSSLFLQKLFAAYAFLMAIRLWLPLSVSGLSSKLLRQPLLFLSGSFFGSFSALVGIGGGTMVVPYLVMARQPVLTAIGTSSACGFPIAVAGVFGYIVFANSSGDASWMTGFIHWQAFLGVISTSILFAHFAAKWTTKIPVVLLRRIFSVVLMTVSVELFLN